MISMLCALLIATSGPVLPAQGSSDSKTTSLDMATVSFLAKVGTAPIADVKTVAGGRSDWEDPPVLERWIRLLLAEELGESASSSLKGQLGSESFKLRDAQLDERGVQLLAAAIGSFRLSVEVQSETLQPLAATATARLHRQAERMDDARKWMLIGLEKSTESLPVSDRLVVKLESCRVLFEEEPEQKLASAIEIAREAKKAGLPRALATANGMQAEALIALERHEDALDHIRSSLDSFKRSPDREHIHHAWYMMIQCTMALKDYAGVVRLGGSHPGGHPIAEYTRAFAMVQALAELGRIAEAKQWLARLHAASSPLEFASNFGKESFWCYTLLSIGEPVVETEELRRSVQAYVREIRPRLRELEPADLMFAALLAAAAERYEPRLAKELLLDVSRTVLVREPSPLLTVVLNMALHVFQDGALVSEIRQMAVDAEARELDSKDPKANHKLFHRKLQAVRDLILLGEMEAAMTLAEKFATETPAGSLGPDEVPGRCVGRELASVALELDQEVGPRPAIVALEAAKTYLDRSNDHWNAIMCRLDLAKLYAKVADVEAAIANYSQAGELGQGKLTSMQLARIIVTGAQMSENVGVLDAARETWSIAALALSKFADADLEEPGMSKEDRTQSLRSASVLAFLEGQRCALLDLSLKFDASNEEQRQSFQSLVERLLEFIEALGKESPELISQDIVDSAARSLLLVASIQIRAGQAPDPFLIDNQIYDLVKDEAILGFVRLLRARITLERGETLSALSLLAHPEKRTPEEHLFSAVMNNRLKRPLSAIRSLQAGQEGLRVTWEVDPVPVPSVDSQWQDALVDALTGALNDPPSSAAASRQAWSLLQSMRGRRLAAAATHTTTNKPSLSTSDTSRLNAAKRKLAALRSSSINAPAATVREAERDLERITDQLRTKYPLFGQLSGRAAEFRQVMERLRPKEAIVEFVSGPEEGFAFVLLPGRSAPVVVRLAAKRAEIVRQARAVQNLFELAPDDGSAIDRQLTVLGDMLIGPLELTLDGIEHLIVAPDPYLPPIPWGALRSSKQPGYEIELRSIAITPSASALEALRRRKSSLALAQQPLVYGVSKFARSKTEDSALIGIREAEFISLPEAVEESNFVAKQVGGTAVLDERATMTLFLERAPRAGLIHLATHARSNVDSPMLSHLRLGDQSSENVLYANDVAAIRLRARLTTLSSCESYGKTATTEGSLGLAWAFLIAGSEDVLATQTKVGDRQAREWVEGFYVHLIGRRSNPTTALREACRAAIKRGVSPAHWGPWVLTGSAFP